MEPTERAIMKVVRDYGNPRLADICCEVSGDNDFIQEIVGDMVRNGYLRMRDNGHHWDYVVTDKGRAGYPDVFKKENSNG